MASRGHRRRKASKGVSKGNQTPLAVLQKGEKRLRLLIQKRGGKLLA